MLKKQLSRILEEGDMDLSGKEMKTWLGIIVASKELKINRCTISDVCNGRKNTAGGFIWKY